MITVAEDQQEAIDIVRRALGIAPIDAVRQHLSNSGKAVYRVALEDGKNVALRISSSPRAFARTGHNLNALRSIQLPVPRLLASGETEAGGSFVILDWIPGRDLVQELNAMNLAQMTRLASQITELQRRVCRLPLGTAFGWAAIGQAGSHRSWSEVFGSPLSQPPPEDGTLLSSLRARLARSRADLDPYLLSVRPVCFLDEMTTKNVLVENGTLRGIIDVDCVCYGDPLLAVGATVAALVADMKVPFRYYGSALMRCWRSDAIRRRATWFYAALWMIGALGQPGEPDRAARLASAADEALRNVETAISN
jgi:aminoglycoside phosphotransferase (APT) family kinase protein